MLFTTLRQNFTRHLDIQTRSSAQPQPVTSACVPASPACACVRVRACAWTLRLSTLPPSTFHKTVFTCLLQVFLTTSCAHAPRQLVTGSVSSTAYYTLQHPTQPQLSSQTAASATWQLAHLFAAAQHSPVFIPAFFFRYFSAGHSRIHTHTSKLTCAGLSQTWRDCSCRTRVVRVNANHVQGTLAAESLILNQVVYEQHFFYYSSPFA